MLGQSLSQGRHLLEERWGLNTLEVPLSEVCRSASFRHFSLHLLRNIDRFRTVHNRALVEHRHLHRIRSNSHPVPELTAAGDWLETPFWIWSAESPSRRAMFARLDPTCITVRAGSPAADADVSLQVRLPIAQEAALEKWEEAERQGIKVRPRALMTTLFARLVLSDLFIHGIGGAKYDQLTDVLIQQFFDVEPPRFITATGTFLLPCKQSDVTDDLLRINRQLREFKYHPEKFVPKSTDANVTDLILEKRRWIDTAFPRGRRLQRHRAIQDLNRRLIELAEPEQDETHQGAAGPT